ncbi:MAG: hypothetical protein ABL931_05515 [Usitatibacteraceae bacterium]
MAEPALMPSTTTMDVVAANADVYAIPFTDDSEGDPFGPLAGVIWGSLLGAVLWAALLFYLLAS